jgi:hypothetical protein
MVTLDASRQLEEEARKAGIKGLCPKAHMKCLWGAVAALLRGETYFYSQQAA